MKLKGWKWGRQYLVSWLGYILKVFHMFNSAYQFSDDVLFFSFNNTQNKKNDEKTKKKKLKNDFFFVF